MEQENNNNNRVIPAVLTENQINRIIEVAPWVTTSHIENMVKILTADNIADVFGINHKDFYNEKSSVGRPLIKLTDEQIKHVEKLAAYLTTTQIADFLGIARDTFNSIKNRQPEVQTAYKKGSSNAIASVAQNLLKQSNDGSTSATIFYLKCHGGEGWREQKEPDTVVNNSTVVMDSEKYASVRQQMLDDDDC